jgi:hypothetical protein
MAARQEIQFCIRSFMQDHYTDEQLVQLLAHATSGKLVYWSCCCFVGIPTADHANRSLKEGLPPRNHLKASWLLTGAHYADLAFLSLADTDKERRAALIPMVRAEIKRRDLLKQKDPKEP